MDGPSLCMCITQHIKKVPTACVQQPSVDWTTLSSCSFFTVQGSMSDQQSCAASADSLINAEEVIAKCSWFQVSSSSTFALALWSYHGSG